LIEQVFTTNFAHSASHLVGKFARLQLPPFLVKRIISAYAVATGASVFEAEEPSGGFKSLSDFFGRRLRPGMRLICEDEGALISPSDGRIVGFGTLEPNGSSTFCIKGSQYNLDALLGANGSGDTYFGGGYSVIYLHPRDYHRVHVPTDALLTSVRHVPGARYPVNSLLEGRVDGIYEKNERVVFHFRLPSGGDFALIMVAAFGVGNIETPYGSGLLKNYQTCCEDTMDPPVSLFRGNDLGVFLLGSTVVLLWSQGSFQIDKEIALGPIAMGNRLGGNM
jgi:phosphatidylserine decarboxylase